MTSEAPLDKHSGNWIFITPVGNLILTDAVNNEFSIGRVLFVGQKKLWKIKRRLGINASITEIRKTKREKDFFESARTYAVVHHKGNQAEATKSAFRLIKDALSVLAISQLGYARRRSSGHIALLGEHEHTSVSYFLFKKGQVWKGQGWRLTRSPQALVLDQRWKTYQRQAFFLKLIKILDGKIRISEGWRTDIRRACVLVGQSCNSNDVATAFLWNMIALELLLTKQGDKYTDVLPKRIEAFLGWIGYWSSDNYEERIRDAYSKRCDFVHKGYRDDITKRDLIFTDDLLLNLLINIVYYIETFNSKQKIIEFADKVEAEHLLGLKSKVRPKRLQFISRIFSESDFDEN